jgi:hypothetical protein
MKRLLLDHFRRKAWILALGAIIQVAIGCSTVAFAGKPGGNPLSSMEIQIGMFMGAFLLSYDLSRGIARTVTTLPLTARQIGRTWWLATVAIPSAAFSALLVAGAGLYCAIHPGTTPDWDTLAIWSVALLMWMGTAYTLVFNQTPAHAGNAWQRARSIAFGCLWGLMLGGGFWLMRNVAAHPALLSCVVILGLALTLFGWFRAGQLVLNRATFRLSTSDGCGSATDSRSPAHRPGGLGGLPLLFRDSLVRTLFMGGVMVLMTSLMMLMTGQIKSWHNVVPTLTLSSPMAYWIIPFITLFSVSSQLRLLRTLPLSAGQLAGVLMALILLPLALLDTTLISLITLGTGTAAALGIVKTVVVLVAPATLAVSLIVWLGLGRMTFMLLFGFMTGAQFIPKWIHFQSTPLGLLMLLAAGVGSFAWFLTRHALINSTKAYRMPAFALGNNWSVGAGR